MFTGFVLYGFRLYSDNFKSVCILLKISFAHFMLFKLFYKLFIRIS